MDEIVKYDVEIQDALTIAPRKVDDVQKYFSVYFCKDRGEKGFKTEEKENIVENVKKSPYTKGVGIVTSWCYPNYEEGVSKIFYLNPEMPFLANGPLVVNNTDFSHDDNFLHKDAIEVGERGRDIPMSSTPIEMHAGNYSKIEGTVKIPEMTCPLETDVVSYHQRTVSSLGPDHYLKYLYIHPKLPTTINGVNTWTMNKDVSYSKWNKLFKKRV